MHTYITVNDYDHLSIARPTTDADDLRTVCPITVAGTYTLRSPTVDGFTHATYGWDGGLPRAIEVTRSIRPLTTAESDRLMCLGDEEGSAYLYRLANTD